MSNVPEEILAHVCSPATARRLKSTACDIQTIFVFNCRNNIDHNAFYRKPQEDSTSEEEIFPAPLASEIFKHTPTDIIVNSDEGGYRHFSLIISEDEDGYNIVYSETDVEGEPEDLYNPETELPYHVADKNLSEALCQMYLSLLKDGVIDTDGTVKDGLLLPLN